MERYNSYKDSGVEWIGEIPSHWVLERYKYLGDSSTTNISVKEFQNEEVIHYSIPNVQKKGTGLLEIGEDIDSSKLLLSGGELMISKLNPRKNCVCIVSQNHNHKILGSGEFVLLKPKGTNTKFLFYYVNNPSYTEYLDSSVESVTRSHQRVNPSIIYNSKVSLPPLSEQQQIVSFLDTKTSLIDSLIEKTQRKIELLKEKRTSLINEVVTKGLNPNVEMKDSGVEWIGKIPSHWVITKVKYVTNLVIDGSHFTPTYTESGIPFLRVTDIHNQIIDLDKVKFISEEEHHSLTKRCQPEKGDLLLSKNGTIGLTKVIDWDWDFSIFVSLCLIKFREVFKPELFSYFFQSSIVDLQIKESSKQSTVTNLHLDKIRELLLIKPPISEQKQIVEYLDEQTQLIDKTISIEEKRIELLKEYRQSLISELVTGKRKVVE